MPIQSLINSLTNTDLKSIKIEINVDYGKSRAGILKGLQIIVGIVCFVLIVCGCYNNYDPYYETYSGIIAGKSETAFILIVFACILWTSLFLFCYTFSVTTSSVIPKTLFELLYNSIAFMLYFITSFNLLIEVSVRNTDRINGISEPGFGTKISASVFGLINSIAYSFGIFYSYKTYKDLNTQ